MYMAEESRGAAGSFSDRRRCAGVQVLTSGGGDGVRTTCVHCDQRTVGSEGALNILNSRSLG
jgi:hypothetical protein